MWNWHSLATTVTVNNGSPFASELGIFYLLDPGESNKLTYQQSDKENSQSSQSSPWSSLASQRPGRALGTSKSGRSTPSHLWAKLVLSGSGPLFAEGAPKQTFNPLPANPRLSTQSSMLALPLRFCHPEAHCERTECGDWLPWGCAGPPGSLLSPFPWCLLIFLKVSGHFQEAPQRAPPSLRQEEMFFLMQTSPGARGPGDGPLRFLHNKHIPISINHPAQQPEQL